MACISKAMSPHDYQIRIQSAGGVSSTFIDPLTPLYPTLGNPLNALDCLASCSVVLSYNFGSSPVDITNPKSFPSLWFLYKSISINFKFWNSNHFIDKEEAKCYSRNNAFNINFQENAQRVGMTLI